MTKKRIVDTDALLALNPEYAQAFFKGERWALEHARLCESLNAGEPEGFRRPFDGTVRKWCGAACPFEEGCITCTLPEDPEMVRLNRIHKHDPMALALRGIITIEGNVDEKMVVDVGKMLEVANKNQLDELEFRFKCDGGSVPEGFKVYDMIRSARVKKRVGVVEYAHSMGAIILQACDWREALPRARMLIHHTRYHDVTIETLKNRAAVDIMIWLAEPDQERKWQVLVSRTKRRLEEIKRLCNQEKYLTAQEALEFGLIDEIRNE